MKRTLMVCVLAAALMAMMATAFAVPELYKVKLAGDDLIPKAPAFIEYTLNCTANITVEIYVWDDVNQVIGAKIRTDGPTSQIKGPHTYMWPCIKDGGIPADEGLYVAKITAAASPTSFSKIIGTYKYSDPTNEDKSGYWNPAVPDGWGFYGVSINTNPASIYYGRIYAPNTNLQEIFIYDCDGAYLKTCDDAGIGWGGSAPWDTYVAADGYVYVTDRSASRIFCFTPDGAKTGTGEVTVSGEGAFYRAMCVRQFDSDADGDLSDEVTHIFHSNGEVIYHSTMNATHTEFSAMTQCANPADITWGVWASPDCGYLLICSGGFQIEVVRKYNKGADFNTYANDATWSCPVRGVDACETPDGAALYVGACLSVGYNTVSKVWKNACKTNLTTANWAASTPYAVNAVIKTTVAWNTWTLSTPYVVGDRVTPTTANGFKYVCTTAGTTAATEPGVGENPVWPTGPPAGGMTVADGTVVWRFDGSSSATFRFRCATAGTSGGTAPTWPTTQYATVGDNTVLWQDASPIGHYNVTSYVKGVQCDAVGNVLITGGKSSDTWPSYYWALATEAGTYSTTKQADRPFRVFPDSAPVVVPGSATWTYSDASGKLLPDDTSTAKVDFKVLDANGYTDIGDVKVNPSSLRLWSDNGTLVDVDSKVQDTSDTNNLTALCRATFQAVAGARAGVHTDLGLEPRDLGYPAVESNTSNVSVTVAGNDFTGTVKHLGHYALISGATMTIVGGMDGVYGYPFTYTTGATADIGANKGQATANISEGSFAVIATLPGYNTQSPSAFPSEGFGGIAKDVWLGPISIAQAKALTSGTLASIAGVCYAQPKSGPVYSSPVPGFAYGLDYRLQKAASETESTLANQWYMCDAGDPNNGMLFMISITSDPVYPYTWDDINKVDAYGNGISLYIGARPVEGRVIWVKGTVDYITTYEKKCVVQDTDFKTESETDPQSYNQTYWNKEAGVVPAPASKTVADVYHSIAPPMIPAPAFWGTFAEVTGAKVVAWLPNAGAIPVGAYTPAFGEATIDTAIIMDNAMNWATVTFQTLASLNITGPPVELRDVYTIKGAGGRRARTGVGTIRPRKTDDIVRTTDNPSDPPGDNIGSIRGPDATGLDLEGIVTAKFTDYMYVESADRSSGARVIADAAAQTLVAVGDRIWFTGDSDLLEGQKQITPVLPFSIVTRGNALPYLGMRTRDIGGHEYGANDPGVAQAFGALNVGLLLKVHGILTYKDTAATPTYFYIWDGANYTGSAVNDGNADGAWGIRINYTPTTAMTPWTSWIEVTGVVSVNQTAVTGSIITIPEIIPSVTPVILAATDFTPIASPAGVVIGGLNLVGVPVTPGDVGNGDSGGWNQPYDPAQVISPGKTQDEIDGRISRWDSAMKGTYIYDMNAEPHGEFGGAILGDGYWLNAPGAWTISYKARVQNIPQWISPGGATAVLMAHPQNHDTLMDPVCYELDPLTGVCMSDGAQVLSFYDACFPYGAGWIGSTGLFWDNVGRGSRYIGVCDDGVDDDTLRPWIGYWFTWRSNYKSMIVP